MYEIEIYQTSEEKSQVIEYFEDCKKNKPKEYKKIYQFIDYLKKNAPILQMPICRYLSNGLYELRPLRHRIIYTYDKEKDIYVLIYAFYKKDKKYQSIEIKRAEKVLRDYNNNRGR